MLSPLRLAGLRKLHSLHHVGGEYFIHGIGRLLDPHYGSKLPRIAQAISALGQRLVIGLEPV